MKSEYVIYLPLRKVCLKATAGISNFKFCAVADCHIVLLAYSARNQRKQIDRGILAVYGMMKKRNKQTTYVAMKEGVENASKRRFDEKMLYQLKNLVPELIELETVPLLTGKTRNERTTVVKLGHVSMVEAKRLLDSALHEYASSSQSTGTAKDVPEWNPSCVEKTHLVPSPEPIEDAIQWISQETCKPDFVVSSCSVLKDEQQVIVAEAPWQRKQAWVNCLTHSLLGLPQHTRLPNDLDVEEALDRLPQDVVDARNQRLKRAMDLSVKHSALPKDMQDKQTPFAFYMQDTLKQIEAENEERELLDSSRPNERHIP
eukprot:jgi/Picre1/34858/NNA_002324.t1